MFKKSDNFFSNTISEFSRRSSGSGSGALEAEDGPARTTVLITDSASIQGLYNLLYNAKIGRITTGPQAGLPPTLIATAPFINGALRELSVYFFTLY